MPRPRLPPTPSGSTELTAHDQTDMEAAFALPPPAMNQKPGSKTTPPVSPQDKPLHSGPQRKRTWSGAQKAKDDLTTMQYDLPPPPSRARKIIQMKPKTGSSTTASGSESVTPQPAQPTKAPAATGAKRKQPSATSAAGRKIARKTAHSIIERRRRSKMNEEFGVLKDMIPACEGVEMHKLAILQAGIEYVRYLEGCIKQMKGDNEERELKGKSVDEDDDDDGSDEDDDESMQMEPPKQPATNTGIDRQYRKPSTATTDSSSDPSPSIVPQRHRLHKPSHRHILPSISALTPSPNPTPPLATPTPTLLSPAFSAIHFSPDLSRTGTNSTQTSMSVANTSPYILPLPQAMMSLDRTEAKSPMSEGGAEATATAALMMLTNDRRSLHDGNGAGSVKERAKGMSVKELLTS